MKILLYSGGFDSRLIYEKMKYVKDEPKRVAFYYEGCCLDPAIFSKDLNVEVLKKNTFFTLEDGTTVNRNLTMVNDAFNHFFKEGEKIEIIIGTNREDTMYDNNYLFFKRLNLLYGEYAEIKTPLAFLTKKDVVKELHSLIGEDIFRISSCYKGWGVECGECNGCKRKAEAMSVIIGEN